MADIASMDLDAKRMDRADTTLSPVLALLTSNSRCENSPEFAAEFFTALYSNESVDYSCIRMRDIVKRVDDAKLQYWEINQIYHCIQALYTDDTKVDLQVAIDDLLMCITLRLYVDNKMHGIASDHPGKMYGKRIVHLKWIDHMRNELSRALHAQHFGYDACVNFNADISIN